ncbi:MAG: TenA family transcriptional regulator [Candidatus Binatia bacterium]
MGTATSFKEKLQAAVMERHCANHPLTERWVKGQLSRNAMMGWAIEHWHWVSKMPEAAFSICAKAPKDVIAVELENLHEETDEARPHLEIVLRFAKANGADIEAIKTGRGLPTTEAWTNWLIQVAREQPWIKGVAAIRIGTESQSPLLYGRMLPALRNIYRFQEEEIEHFWLHVEADTEHGGRAFEVLERHCTTPELQEMAIHYARESAKMRWFYFDGIYLHYEMGYKLA